MCIWGRGDGMNMTITSDMMPDTMNTSRLCAPGAIIDGKRYVGWQVNQESLLKPLSWRNPRHVELRYDLFHPNVMDEQIDRVFAVMALCPQHTFQVLTKRPERMLKYLNGAGLDGASVQACRLIQQYWHRIKWMPEGLRWNVKDAPALVVGLLAWPLPNVWLGVSVEDQKTADERIPLLLQMPAAVRFIRAEPLLGAIDIEAVPYVNSETLDWVIVGGESGPGARPMHPDWARSLRDQCVAAGVPFFFKQWGEWLPWQFDGGYSELKSQSGKLMDRHALPDLKDASVRNWTDTCLHDGDDVCVHQRVGKKAAGHLLDGEEWHQFPEAR